MLVAPDKGNLSRLQIVFQGTAQDGDDFGTAEECAQWDPRVDVVFQPKVWVDTRTNVMFTRKMTALNKWVKDHNMIGR